MTTRRADTETVHDTHRRDTHRCETLVLDDATFRRLVAEGQEFRRVFEVETVGMRVITPEDLRTRSR